MKMNVVKENENKLLHRKELELALTDTTVTPSKKEIMASVSANLGASEGAIVLGSVYQNFGKKEAVCSVKIYDNEEWRKKIEPKPKEKPKEETKEGEKK